jgi:hypothetical protein
MLVVACGGGGGDSTPAPPSVLPLPAGRISVASPVAAGCTGGSTSGGYFVNAEVEPFVVADPAHGNHLVATWQQDRWTNGGARAVMTAASFDGGHTWSRTLQPMSRCAGGTLANGGDYERATDPWVDIAPDGTVYAMALAFSGASGQASASAMLVSRSTDGGVSWSAPVALIRDGAAFFNDKNALTADPHDAHHVYAVWDRLAGANGPSYFARSTDGGLSWEAAHAIYTPASGSQTIGNRIVVLPDGTLANFFTQIDTAGGSASAHLDVIRSADKGVTWSASIRVADLRAVGASDPDTGAPIRDAGVLASIGVAPDGGLWATWQDARLSGGQRDAILLSHSGDGGLSWSAPVGINRNTNVSAFIPTLHVRADGTVAVMHYDLRDNTADPTTLLADAWLLTSRDGVAWTETRVWGPFDLAGAPTVDAGRFLGDYQGLTSNGGSFIPVLALSSTDTSNRTDIYAIELAGLAARDGASSLGTPVAREATGAASAALSPEAFRRRVHENIVRTMERRLPGWSQRMRLDAPPR